VLLLFAHLTKEVIEFFQAKVDESWEKWWIPGIVPFGPQADD
jgi:hypothetical protein